MWTIIILLVLNAGNEGMIHWLTINNHPSNPQQPIHSLRKTHQLVLITRGLKKNGGLSHTCSDRGCGKSGNQTWPGEIPSMEE